MTAPTADLRLATVADIATSMRFARDPDGPRLGTTIFLIGAGCSVSAGIPGASVIAKRMVRDVSHHLGTCAPGLDADGCYRSLAEAGKLGDCGMPAGGIDWYRVYDEMFKTHYVDPNDARALFGRLMIEARGGINWAHLCLGELVAQRFISTVLTTNFDQLALTGMVRAGVIPVVCDALDSLNRITGTPGHPQLVELHGSRHTYQLRNAPDEVEEVRNDHQASGTILELLRHATVFVAIGYGGRENGVMDLLVRSVTSLRNKRLYWINHSANPAAISPKVRAFLATSSNSRLVPGQDADGFFLELSQALGVGAPSAIARPLETLARLIADVSRHPVSNPDIQAEIAAARVRLDRLQELDSGPEARDPVAELATRIRELRLAGKNAEAYRLAADSVVSAVPSATDRPIVEEAASAALDYGLVATEPEPLANAVRWLRHLLDTALGQDPARARLAIDLGEALWRSAGRDPGRTGLEDALTYLRRMTVEIDRKTAPLDWAALQNNLGNALKTLGERESGTARLDEAVAAYRAALDERTRDRVPRNWAATQYNLANVLATLAERMKDRTRMTEAIASMRDAAEVYRQGNVTYWLPIAEQRIAAMEATLAKMSP